MGPPPATSGVPCGDLKPPAKAPTLEETGKRRRGRSIKPEPQSQSIDPPPPPPPRSDSVQASAGDSADVSGYFEVLGISPGASPKEVQTAYRNSALRTHPDKGGSAEKQSTAVGSLIQQCGVRSEKRANQATLPCSRMGGGRRACGAIRIRNAKRSSTIQPSLRPAYPCHPWCSTCRNALRCTGTPPLAWTPFV